MTKQLREMLKYFQNPTAENRTKQSKRSAIVRSLVRLDQYIRTYKYYIRKWMSKILFRIVGIFIKCQALGSHSGAGKGFSLHIYDTMQIRVQVEMFLRTCCLVFRVVQKATSHSSWTTLKMEAASSSKMVIPINNLHGIISENGILKFIPYRLDISGIYQLPHIPAWIFQKLDLFLSSGKRMRRHLPRLT